MCSTKAWRSSRAGGDRPVLAFAPWLLTLTTFACAAGPAPANALAPERCVGRDPAQELSVRFEGADGFWLEGVLSLPERARGERLPAVVLAHPAGAVSRDGTTKDPWALVSEGERPLLAELALGLRERGFVVLRFDKRNCGPWNACGDNDYPRFDGPVGVHDLERDLSSALDAVLRVPGVDGERVHLFGYGESAIFVPRILRTDRRVTSGVAFALDRRSLGQAALARAQHLAELGSASGRSETQLATLVARAYALGRDLTELGAFGAGGPAQIEGRRDAVWVDALRFHAQSLSPRQWANAGPVLLVYGGRDWTLPVPDVQAWEREISAAKRQDRVLVLPCVTHTLACVDASSDVHPALLDEVARHFREARSSQGSARPRASCEAPSATRELRLPWGRPIEQQRSPATDCVRERGCEAKPIATCERGLVPHSLMAWAEDGARRSFAARLGVRHGPVTEMECEEECCNSSTATLDLREQLHQEGISFEFAPPLTNLCEGDDSGVCCPLPPHSKDGGGLVLATGTIAGRSLVDVSLCRPLPEDYPMLDFTFGSPPLDVTSPRE